MKRKIAYDTSSNQPDEPQSNTLDATSNKYQLMKDKSLTQTNTLMIESNIDDEDHKQAQMTYRIEKLLDNVESDNLKEYVTPSRKANYIHKLLSGRGGLDDTSRMKNISHLNVASLIHSCDIGTNTTPIHRIDQCVETDPALSGNISPGRHSYASTPRDRFSIKPDPEKQNSLPVDFGAVSGNADVRESQADNVAIPLPTMEEIEGLLLHYMRMKAEDIEGLSENIKHNCNIKVMIRCRPTNTTKLIECKGNRIRITKPGNSKSLFVSQRPKSYEYEFDRVFNESSTQDEVYNESVRNLIPNVISGINLTIFAYGCTGSGKTYTMMGNDDTMGLVQLSLADLFKLKQGLKINFSFFEIYNESIFDLLNNNGKSLEVQEDSKHVYIQGLTNVAIHDINTTYQLINRGIKYRKVQMTNANRNSSRSHAILQFTLEDNTKFTFIDLAGSERASVTEHRGECLKESSYINQSLLALANCINTLSEGTSRVKYRDSKLTHILKNSLLGDSMVVMIALINPNIQFYQESSNTLKYANRAKNIKIYRREVEVDGDKATREFLGEVLSMFGTMCKMASFKCEDVCNVLRRSDLKSNKLIIDILTKMLI